MARLSRIVRGLWFGSGAFILLSAAAVFRAAGTPTAAANVVGALLTRWHYVALAAPLALLVLQRRRNRISIVLIAAIFLAALEALIDVKIRLMRLDSLVPISSLPGDDPVRRQFGILHAISSLLLLAQVAAAMIETWFADDHAPTPPAPPTAW